MRSSKKKIIGIIAAFVAAAVIIWFLDIMLYPCTYLRNDIHTISTVPNDTIILGTSNGKMGIDPDSLLEGTGLSGHNLAAGSEYPVDSYYITKLAVDRQQPKQIIYEVDPGYFTTEKEKGNNYVLFYHEFPVGITKADYASAILADSDFRALLFPFYEYPLSTTFKRAGDNISKKFSGDYSIDSLKNKVQEYHENGFIEKFDVAEADFPKYQPEPFSKEAVLKENAGWIDKLIRYCKDRDIEFVAVTMPLPEKTLQQTEAGFEEAFDYFETYFAEHGVKYYNFNREYYNAYSHDASHFVDYDGHLNGTSAREFSAIFGEQLKQDGFFTP